MTAIDIILIVIDIIAALALIILFLAQEGNDQGMGVVSGASSNNDSYYSKSKGRTLEERLKQATKVSAIVFAVVSVLLFLAFTKGF